MVVVPCFVVTMYIPLSINRYIKVALDCLIDFQMPRDTQTPPHYILRTIIPPKLHSRPTNPILILNPNSAKWAPSSPVYASYPPILPQRYVLTTPDARHMPLHRIMSHGNRQRHRRHPHGHRQRRRVILRCDYRLSDVWVLRSTQAHS